MYLGEIIYDYRAKNKLTLKQFSERSGLSVAYLSQLENNRNPRTGRPAIPSSKTIYAVANAMRMDVGELVRELDQNQLILVSSPSSGMPLTDDEMALLENYRELNDEGQNKVLDYTIDLVAGGRYIKTHPDTMVDPDAPEVNK